jgi:RNA polymerase sigma-70 factor, ECF subfamily
MQATMPIMQDQIHAFAGSGNEVGRIELGRIFNEHKDLVFHAAYRVTGNSSDAEDVLQTVFLRLMRSPQSTEVRYLPAYLHRAAVNAALDLLRARKDSHNLPLEEQSEIAGASSAAIQQETGELQAWLRRALAQVNPAWAEMFVLRFVEGYGNREIARMTGTSAAAVAVALHRTRAHLRKDYMSMMRGRR